MHCRVPNRVLTITHMSTIWLISIHYTRYILNICRVCKNPRLTAHPQPDVKSPSSRLPFRPVRSLAAANAANAALCFFPAAVCFCFGCLVELACGSCTIGIWVSSTCTIPVIGMWNHLDTGIRDWRGSQSLLLLTCIAARKDTVLREKKGSGSAS